MGTILLGFEPSAVSKTQLAQVQAIAQDMEVVVTSDREEIEGLLEEIEIAAGGFPKDLVLKARNLRWFQQWSAGSDWLLHYPEVAHLDVVLTKVAAVQPIPVSEHALAFLFTFAQKRCSEVAFFPPTRRARCLRFQQERSPQLGRTTIPSRTSLP